MSDGIDPSTQVRRTRSDDSSSSNSNFAIILAVVVVVLGILILRSMSSGVSSIGVVGSTTTVPLTPVVTEPPTTLAPALPTTPDFTGASIIVVNANGTKGSASTMTDALRAINATLVNPTNAPAVETSQILYNEANPAALKVATSLTFVLSPAPSPQPLVGAPPIEGDLQGADVILLLGKDLASATVNPPAAPVTTVTLPLPTTTLAPAPAG